MIDSQPNLSPNVDFHNNCTVYVSNIPVETTAAEFANAFRQYGEVRGSFLNGPRPTKLFGFGFICFCDPRSPSLAINSITELHGQVLTVRYRRLEDMKGMKPKRAKLSKTKPTKLNETDFNDLSNCPTEVLLYGSNGHIQVMNETTEFIVNSTVVRVDCVPHFWDAKKLFEYMSQLDFPVVAALVYNDIDDRHFRQGLLQTASLQTAGELLQMGKLKTSEVCFDIKPSAVKSVGNMRSSYIGRFTVYSMRRNEPESPKEAFNPLDDLAFTPSPATTPFDLETPTTVNSDFEYQKQASPTVFATPTNPAFVRPASRFSSAHFGHKMSQTIVVDNFERKYVENAKQLAAWMSRYGEVLTADIVSTSPQLVRAYISFDTPASAGIALGQLSMCVSGTHALRVRMA